MLSAFDADGTGRLSAGIRKIAQLLMRMHWRDVRMGRWHCACCGWTVQLRLAAADHGVRCSRCGASAITQSLVDVLQRTVGDPAAMTCLELSGRGALVAWLGRHAGSLMRTEYMPGKSPGCTVDGVRNEDVQALTFAQARFDLCTSTEVFEHVQDDMAGFREVLRVLKPGGAFVFTVPLTGAEYTVERARMVAGSVQHMLEPEYHNDPYSGSNRVLCFRNYGTDITARLRAAGFREARIEWPRNAMLGAARGVIVARK